MKYLKLQNSDKTVIVEDGDYDRLTFFKWFLSAGTIFRNINKDSVMLQNEILQKSGVIDHWDRNIFNCLRRNLRPCTTSQNCMNRKKPASSKRASKYKGVSIVKLTGKWLVTIKVNGISKYVGTFNDEVLAAIAYDDAALFHFGEFACINFPLVIY